MRLDHIVLLASDPAASARHYDALLPLLGFTKTRDHVYGNDHLVYFDIRPATDDAGYRRHAAGINHIAIDAGSVAAVDAVRDAMIAMGHAMADVQTIDDTYALFVSDPDGFRIEVSAIIA